jgi:hypothetical protein
MGHNWIQPCTAPPRRGPGEEVEAARAVGDEAHAPGVAVQVEFEKQTLKPVSHLIGSMVETRRFQAMGQLHFNMYSPTPARASRSDAGTRCRDPTL